jgi:tRNA (cmo5U34)-methyltransferase
MTDSTLDAPAVFEAHAAGYEAPRRRLVPPFDAFYGTAVDALGLVAPGPRRVLDLGAGTGMLAARVAAAHPQAEFVLVDGAPAMLAQARERLGDRATYHLGDLRDPLPAGGFCAVVSALAIHHLEYDAKRDLFARVHDALLPGGIFVNAEQVLGPSPYFDARFRAWHEASARALGTTDAEWAASLERMEADRCASVEDQLAWMRAAGLDSACLFADHRFAVLAGRRPPLSAEGAPAA